MRRSTWRTTIRGSGGLGRARRVGHRAAAGSNALGQKLVQLTMPGVPDVYQGTELWEDSLVDPDNRRPVDFAARADAAGRGRPALPRSTHPARPSSG